MNPDPNKQRTIERLAREIRAISTGSRASPTPGRVDEALRGLFDRSPPAGAFHEIVADRIADRGAATGFALALTADRSRRKRHVLWICDGESLREGGPPHAPGLAAFGLDPDGLLFLPAANARDALWAAEEGLETDALSAVLVEMSGAPRALDATALRRLKLRGEANGVVGLLLRHGTAARADDGLPVDLRWRVAAAASDADGRHLLGPPTARVDLVKNRFGRTGSLVLVWEAHHALFRAISGDRSAPSGVGPPAAAGAGGLRARAG